MAHKTTGMFAALIFLLAACSPTRLANVPTQANPTGQPAGKGMADCQVSGLIPDVAPTMTAAIVPVGADDHVLGKPDARVTILEYGDFQ